MISRIQMGSAHYGTRDWLTQRLCAFMVVLYILSLLASLAFLSNTSLTWQLLFSQTWMKIWTQIAALAFSWSMWIEIRDVLMDYIKTTFPRIVAYLLVVIWLLGCFLYLTQVIWS
jgi:succinate dehydrogenase / fumarate reductase membrane anchor subunit